MMADVPPDPDSGAAGTEWQTARALERAGVDVHTVWASDLRRRVRHWNLHYLLELPLAYRAALRRQLRQGTFDVVHVNQPHGYLAARELRARDPAAVFVHRSHGFEGRVEEDLAPWKVRYAPMPPAPVRLAHVLMQAALTVNNRMIARHAHGHIVSASQCAAYLQRRHGVAAQRIAVIPQAAPPGFLEPLAHLKDEGRCAKLLYVGQFAFIKAPFFVAQVAQQVLRARPQASFTWVCEERSHAAARALFTEAGVLPRVRFLPWQPQQQLRDLYDAHGLFLFPSLFEGFGKAFMEAMTRGLCVIAADNGGMRDVIRHGETGLLAPTGDCDAMARHCIGLIDNPGDCQRMGAAARVAGQAYTWDGVGRETLAFYERLLRLNARARAGNALNPQGS
jgi:glycosyltransferase involved in cell wall biosynthesis